MSRGARIVLAIVGAAIAFAAGAGLGFALGIRR